MKTHILNSSSPSKFLSYSLVQGFIFLKNLGEGQFSEKLVNLFLICNNNIKLTLNIFLGIDLIWHHQHSSLESLLLTKFWQLLGIIGNEQNFVHTQLTYKNQLLATTILCQN